MINDHIHEQVYGANNYSNLVKNKGDPRGKIKVSALDDSEDEDVEDIMDRKAREVNFPYFIISYQSAEMAMILEWTLKLEAINGTF